MKKILNVGVILILSFLNMVIEGNSQEVRKLPKSETIIPLEELKIRFDLIGSAEEQHKLDLPYLDLTHLAVLDENNLCRKHHIRLEIELVKVHCGFKIDIGDEQQYYQSKKDLFPNATLQVSRCTSRGNSKPLALVLNCSFCKRFRESWVNFNSDSDHFYF